MRLTTRPALETKKQPCQYNRSRRRRKTRRLATPFAGNRPAGQRHLPSYQVFARKFANHTLLNFCHHSCLNKKKIDRRAATFFCCTSQEARRRNKPPQRGRDQKDLEDPAGGLEGEGTRGWRLCEQKKAERGRSLRSHRAKGKPTNFSKKHTHKNSVGRGYTTYDDGDATQKRHHAFEKGRLSFSASPSFSSLPACLVSVLTFKAPPDRGAGVVLRILENLVQLGGESLGCASSSLALQRRLGAREPSGLALPGRPGLPPVLGHDRGLACKVRTP